MSDGRRSEADAARFEELERRIREIESADGERFGAFTQRDWWICVVGAVVLPILALIAFAR